jgi:DNA-binding NtrC family response regulator
VDSAGLPTTKKPDASWSFRKTDRILVVEDEAMVSLDIESVLQTRGAQGTLFARTLADANAVIVAEQGISLVIVDLKLSDGDASALVASLIDSATPVVVVTGYSDFAHSDVPVVFKPFTSEQLLAAALSAMNANRLDRSASGVMSGAIKCGPSAPESARPEGSSPSRPSGHSPSCGCKAMKEARR